MVRFANFNLSENSFFVFSWIVGTSGGGSAGKASGSEAEPPTPPEDGSRFRLVLRADFGPQGPTGPEHHPHGGGGEFH